ncbi:LysR substrate-binding domain-containing protein [Shimia biformata]|uniref:LysR substrate-binding domain-containing protein n=1 Tax=Shimia biformata TaxID=1294299 RepID=UPI003B836DBC
MATVTSPEVEDVDLIDPARGISILLLIDEAMAHARIGLGWAYEIRRSTTALELVGQGIGNALLLRSSVQHLEDSGLTFRPMVDPEIIRPAGLLSRRGQLDGAPVQALKSEIRKAAIARMRAL